MGRKLIAPAALAGVLLLAPHAWAPPPGRPSAPPPPPPPRPNVVPMPGPRPPGGGAARPPGAPGRPPVIITRPDFAAQMDAARRRNAAEAAELLRKQSAASLNRAQRAAMLNALTHQMLRQQQAAHLADLRRLRADWAAVGPGAGLDPVLAMQLEAAESAAERLLLAEVLALVRDGRFSDAASKLAALDSPRYLPAPAALALPDLRAALKRAAPFAQARAEFDRPVVRFPDIERTLSDVPKEELPAPVGRARAAWAALAGLHFALNPRWNEPVRPEEVGKPKPVVDTDTIEIDLKGVADEAVARKLRAELAAQLFLDGRAKDAAELLEGEVDPVHAAAVLADLRAALFGRGAITIPQIAALVPADRTAPPAQSAAVLPPDQLARWQPPARAPGETTIDIAIADARQRLKAAVGAALDASTATVTAAAGRVRAALAAEAGPQNVFVEKVGAALQRPFASPAERQLAVTAGTRGLTVAEAVGVLSAEADRPAAAVRLLAAVPVFTGAPAFAAAVELSGRAPAAFAPRPDADFKLPAGRDRARVRDAVSAVLNLQAARTVAGQNPPELGRAALEAEVARRLGGADPLAPEEAVLGVLDVCGDWADDHARLAAVARELNEIVADIEGGEYGPVDDELTDLLATAKLRRMTAQMDRKRREAGVAIGCQVLGGYGPAAAPAADWLGAQCAGEERPWHAAAALARARVAPGK